MGFSSLLADMTTVLNPFQESQEGQCHITVDIAEKLRAFKQKLGNCGTYSGKSYVRSFHSKLLTS